MQKLTPQKNISNSHIRRRIKAERRELPRSKKLSASLLICLRIAKHPSYRRARSIALYFASLDEASLTPLIKLALEQNKHCYFPVITGNQMAFHRFSRGNKKVTNRFGLKEPSRHAPQKKLRDIDLVLCPLVSFDNQGNRIGMGGGFYDRGLSSIKNRRKKNIWGVAFSLQQCEAIKPEAWDIKVDGVFTERCTMTSP